MKASLPKLICFHYRRTQIQISPESHGFTADLEQETLKNFTILGRERRLNTANSDSLWPFGFERNYIYSPLSSLKDLTLD